MMGEGGLYEAFLQCFSDGRPHGRVFIGDDIAPQFAFEGAGF
jgi:hypothetical protein